MANEKRLIDVNKLRGLKYEKVKFSDYREGWNDAIDTICTETFLPSVDAVEVVRCKDCTHYSHCESCSEWHTDTNPEDFCSRGERKDND